MAEQPKSGGTLRVAFEADVTGLDPAIPGLQNYYVNQNLFNTLVTLDENLGFVPDLAESWDIQQQGKVYIFHLRRGVKFHDGTDFDAAAAKWNLDRIMADEKAPAHRFFANVEASEVVDGHTLKITMRYPTTTLLSALATEVIDRPIFLKRLLRDRDYDQVINMALPFLDVGDRGFVLERGGLNLPNHSDSKVDEMFDQWRRTLDPQEQRHIAEAIQGYVAETALYTAVCGNPIINAHRADVKGYTYMRGLLVMFERTWLDRP